jgi:nucleotide-binding universal stress UspA family protein
MNEREQRAMTVVLATDGSQSAEMAMELVRSIAWPDGSAIHLVNAIEPADTVIASAWAPGVAAQIDAQLDDMADAAEVALGHAARSLAETGVRIEIDVLRGRAGSAIVEKAQSVSADVIVLGSRGHGTIGAMLLGSVSGEVADHAHCPVLVARSPRLTRVILGTDGSSYARTAERVVAEWPIFAPTAIEVTSVASLGLPWTSSLALSASATGADDMLANGREIVAEYRRVAEESAARLVQAGLRASARVLQGDAAAELVRIAHEDQADLIAVGTHGRTGLRRLVAGSVARNVMLHAPCSVLVVREARPLT